MTNVTGPKTNTVTRTVDSKSPVFIPLYINLAIGVIALGIFTYNYKSIPFVKNISK